MLQNNSDRPQKSNTLIGITALLIWSSSLPFSRQCVPHLGTYTTIALAYFVSGLLGFVWFFITARSSLRNVFKPFFPLRFILFTLYSLLLYPAISLVKLENFPVLILLNYLWPTFTLLFTLWIMKQPYQIYLMCCGIALVICGLSVEIFGSELYESEKMLSFEFIPYILEAQLIQFPFLHQS